MLEGLQTEIDAHPELSGASQKIIMAALNAPGSAEAKAWVTNPDEALYSINDIYTKYIGNATLENLIDHLALAENKALALRFDKATHFDLSSPVVLAMLSSLLSADVCTQAEYDTLVRLGQIQISRAEELFSRKITMEDF